jgi:cytochrome c-type protein NapB
MRKVFVAMKLGLAVTLAGAFALPPAFASEEQSLRGDNALLESLKPAKIYKLDVPDEVFPRAYKTQPPLISHKVTKYKINLKGNGCLKCHDKSKYKEEEAPMAGKSHYIGLDGKEGNSIMRTRYFCTQCHVPQMDAKPLVKNTFIGVKFK